MNMNPMYRSIYMRGDDVKGDIADFMTGGASFSNMKYGRKRQGMNDTPQGL